MIVQSHKPCLLLCASLGPIHSVGLTLRSSPQTRFHPRRHCKRINLRAPTSTDDATACQTGRPARKRQNRSGQSRVIKTGQAAQLSNPEGAVGELSCDTCNFWPFLLQLQRLCANHANWAKEISSISVPSEIVLISTRIYPLKVWLGISRTNADFQWNPVYKAFHRIRSFGHETIRR